MLLLLELTINLSRKTKDHLHNKKIKIKNMFEIYKLHNMIWFRQA